jgi:dienelactone hydrolase
MSKGSVIRCETFLERTKLSMSLDPQVTIAGKPALYGLKIVRIVYLTEPRPGLKRWTSSLLYVPTNNDGSCRKSAPLALVAHGTTGLASTCGPSRYPAFGVQYMTMPLVARGFLTIAPDYMGLGLPSRSQHPYLVKEPTIASMMDAVRAVRELSRQGSLAGCAGTKLVMVGHSQGGHAVLKAGAQTRKELPGVQHAGTVSFAPALGSAGVWLEGLKANFRTTPGTVYLLSLYWAAEQYYGYKKNWLRADFRKRWSVLTQQMCFSELDALIRGAYPQLGNIFTQEFLNATLTCETSGNCSGYEPFYSMVRNNISGTDKPNAPTLLVQGSRDSVVTTSSVRCIADRLRNHGSQHKSCLISNASHASVVSSGWKQVLPWLEALVRGQTPPSLSCSNSWPACK